MTISLRYAALSDVGQVRKNNQDSGYASPNLLLVADGMGGQAAGDLASAEAVQAIRRLDAPAPDDLLEALAGALHRANDRLGQLVEDDGSLDGMGTTVTAMLVQGDRIGLAHIGDSRAYLLRDDQLSQLTHDHTFVQSLVDEGRINEDEARTHPHRSLILKALQGRDDIEPDLTELTFEVGDRVLLCSDGLCGFVDNATIASILRSGTPDSAVVELVRTALTERSSDNITCIVADALDAEEGSLPTEAMIVGAAAELPQGAESTRRTSSRIPVVTDEHDEASAVDPEELRYAPRARGRFSGLRRIVAILVGLGLIAVALWGLYVWSQRQYFVADAGGNVAIYQGVQLDLPGVTLSHLYKTSDLPLDSLPDYNQEQVSSGMDYNSLDEARQILTRLEELLAECSTANPSPSTDCLGAQPTTQPTTPTTAPTTQPTRQPTTQPTKQPTQKSGRR